MKAAELTNQSRSQLQATVAKQQAALADLKIKVVTEEFKAWHQLRALRLQIAQTKTILRSQELAKGDKDG